MTKSKVPEAQAPADETIPTAELLALVREHAAKNGWCGSVETLLTEHLDLRFQRRTGATCGLRDCELHPVGGSVDRLTPVPDAPEALPKAAVVAAIRKLRRNWGGSVADMFTEAGEKWGLDLSPAFRLRVTIMLGEDELSGDDFPVGEDGKPSDLKHSDLVYAVVNAIGDLDYSRIKVSVAR